MPDVGPPELGREKDEEDHAQQEIGIEQDERQPFPR
jgi:hypothetical protein